MSTKMLETAYTKAIFYSNEVHEESAYHAGVLRGLAQRINECANNQTYQETNNIMNQIHAFKDTTESPRLKEYFKEIGEILFDYYYFTYLNPTGTPPNEFMRELVRT